MAQFLITLTLAVLTQSPCRVHKDNVFVPDNTLLACSSIVDNIKGELKDKMCLCVSGKWEPQNKVKQPTIPITKDGNVKPAFFGNIIGHAKLLCGIVESIDCWQNNPSPRPFPMSSSINQTLRGPDKETVTVVTPNGDALTAPMSNIIDVIKTICGVIDSGSEILPDILPGIIDEEDSFNGGLPWVLPNIVKRLLSGFKGIFDLIDIIGFFDIFTFNNDIEKHKKIELQALDR